MQHKPNAAHRRPRGFFENRFELPVVDWNKEIAGWIHRSRGGLANWIPCAVKEELRAFSHRHQSEAARTGYHSPSRPVPPPVVPPPSSEEAEPGPISEAGVGSGAGAAAGLGAEEGGRF